jgi:hypothetical protein
MSTNWASQSGLLNPQRSPELGGMEGSEVIMWLVMRGALSANVTETWRDYYLPQGSFR